MKGRKGMKICRAAIVVVLSVVMSGEGSATPNLNSVYWGRETCVIYDYRPLLTSGKKPRYIFALELKNHNGGEFKEFVTSGSESPAKSLARLLNKIEGLVKTGVCDRLEVFLPSSENDSSKI